MPKAITRKRRCKICKRGCNRPRVTEIKEGVEKSHEYALTAGRVKSVAHPDGRLDTYTYETGVFTPRANPALSRFTPGQGADVRETVTYGTISSPAGVANKTTREITIENELGSQLFSETLVFDGGSFHRVEWTAWSLDQFDRVASI
ncbi:MAG: hypothetical protein GY850_13225, partial [bacterium]|nr:hypothetical protein [bacterium]